jgi:hypothetical protein
VTIDFDSLVNGPVADTFAEPVIFRPASGGSFPVRGVFDRAYRAVEVTGNGEAVTSVHPCIQVRLSEMPQRPAQGDLWDVPSVALSFITREVQPDGLGFALLLLNIAP